MIYAQANILIVDDKIDNVMLLEYLLEEEGYENVSSTTDPQEVVRLVQDNDIDLILLDIRMPVMDGHQVMKALGEVLPEEEFLPILVLTAQTDSETKELALSNGAHDFLTKPFDPTEVCLRIHNMLRTRTYYRNQVMRGDVLETEVQKRTREITLTRREIVNSLGRAAEYRDNETGAHVIRMSKSCGILARKAGLGEEFANLIVEASPMHDIGKIGTPDRILLKQGPLEADERAIMNEHVNIGVEILGNHESKLLKMARVIAKTHHEKWDGSGYPNGLAGLDIPIEGRIASICDVFDALTSARPYKDAWPVERALNVIKEDAGTHFDPELVEMFCDILPDVLKLKEEYPDS